MGTLRCSRDRQMLTVAALALALFSLLLLHLTPASARPLGPESLPLMRGGPSGGRAATVSSSPSRVMLERAAARTLLEGPGSVQPSCKSKCGSCSPCKPVLVPVPPGRIERQEYYPEAWRCQCGNKLFMP